MKALQAFLAFVVLALLLGGVPILLLAWGDPLSLMEVSWSTAFTRPDDGTILLGLLSVVGWIAWVVIAVTTITELISLLSRTRIRIQLPGITWLQPVVGALVAMALSPVLSSHADEPSPPPASHAPQEVEQESHSVAPPEMNQSPPLRELVVQRGDELWGLAERELGNGAHWRSIIASNPGMTADTVLKPGEIIKLPPAVDSVRAAPSADASYVTVERHDTLWDLAEEHLGDAQRWPEIFNANMAVVSDPDEIDIGWQLALPTDATVTTPSEDDAVPGGDEAASEDWEKSDLKTPASSEVADGGEGSSPSSVPEIVTASPTASQPADVSTSSPESSPKPPAERADSAVPTAENTTVSPSAATTSPHATNSDTPVPIDSELSGSSSGTSLDMLGPLGGALAASVVAGVMARRHVQLLHRGLGTRIAPLAPTLQRFFAGLMQRAQSAPAGALDLGATSVVVGWQEDGGEDEDVIFDLEQKHCTLITGPEEHTASMAAAILTSLLCADWSAGVEVVAVQPDEEWSSAFDDPRLTGEEHLEAALIHLQRLCSQRRLELGHDDLAHVRADPDRAAMWAPVVFVFCRPLPRARLDRIHDCLSLGLVGVSVVAAAHASEATEPLASILHIDSGTSANLNSGRDFQPQLLSKPARHAVMSLFATALNGPTMPAPWWRHGEETAATASPIMAAGPFKDGAMSAWPTHPANPTLLVLGPVELLGTSGEPPTRAMGQCIEYCAWLLLHPGSPPTTMVRELLVAETTRRSNMSRLRSWLGSDTDGKPYLPDAYSGRISLAPSVTSDWERFQSLLAGGVNTSSTPLLHEALSLVRGRPLDGVSFQWPWTSQWLMDMISMISDAATVLADRYMTEHDYPAALWALDQGQLATGDDETLSVRRIQILAHIGERADVDAAVTHLTRAARAANRELSEDSIRRIQHALHLTMQRIPSA